MAADDQAKGRAKARSSASGSIASLFFPHNYEIRTESASYRVQRKIGRGGNGTTFLVTCTSGDFAGVLMAMKVFHRIQDERRKERFSEEIKFYRSINHPSIIKLYDESSISFRGSSYPAAFVEYAPDDLVAHMVTSGGQLSRIQALRLGMNVASGLSFLHRQKLPIIHRDIKPANILVIGGTAKLGDLGLAKELSDKAPESDQERDGEEVLRPYVAMPRFYRTPELVALARGESVDVTGKSDVFQFGCVFYQTLTGFNPQIGTEDIKADVQLDIRQIRGDQGERLHDLVASMLQLDPSKRPDASSVLEEMVRIHRDHSAAITALTGDDT